MNNTTTYQIALPRLLTDDPATMKPGKNERERKANEERTVCHMRDFFADLGFDLPPLYSYSSLAGFRDWQGQQVDIWLSYWEIPRQVRLTFRLSLNGQELSHPDALSLLREIAAETE